MPDRPDIVIYEDDDEILFGFTDERWAAISDDPREPLTPLPDPDVANCDQPA